MNVATERPFTIHWSIVVLSIVLLLFASGCSELGLDEDDRVYDTSALSSGHQVLFAAAAAAEGEQTSSNVSDSKWSVEYGRYIEGSATGGPDSCRIHLTPQLMSVCPDLNKRFMDISRHEIRHCRGTPHSFGLNDLMNSDLSCNPTY